MIYPDTALVHIQGYALRSLVRETDQEALQQLYEACADFNWLVDGAPVSPTAAQEEFDSVPPGHSLDDKFLYGLADDAGALVGVLEGLRGYPQPGVWWIGLMMLAPVLRGAGLGSAMLTWLAAQAQAHGVDLLMLGVVEENQAAYCFWEKQGFRLVRTTEPKPFGEKVQRVHVMEKRIPGEG